MLHGSVTFGLCLGMTLTLLYKSFPGNLPLMALMSSIIYSIWDHVEPGPNTILSLRIMSVLKMETCLHK